MLGANHSRSQFGFYDYEKALGILPNPFYATFWLPVRQARMDLSTLTQKDNLLASVSGITFAR